MAACSACIKALRVDQRTLSMYATPDAEALTARLVDVLRDDMLEARVDELIQLWSGEPSFESRSINYTSNGHRLDIPLRGVVLSDHAQSWDHVAVAAGDIIELEDAHHCAAAGQLYAHRVFEYAPVSLWVENFNTIKMLLDEVHMQGITDFRTFADVYPEFIERYMQKIQVLNVSGFALETFKACNHNNLLGCSPEIFCGDMRPYFHEQLIDLWEGRLFQ